MKILEDAKAYLMSDCQKTLEEANAHELHNAVSNAVMANIAPLWKKSRKMREDTRRAYYFSAEYLMGRMIYNNLFALGISDSMKTYLRERNIDFSLFDEVDDVALGNGGLGRLAACFLDSAATHDIPLDGYGLRYRYGLFSQRIERGFQKETADNWQKWGDPWSKRRDDETIPVAYGDMQVLAVPYDMPIIGYRSDTIGTLRLFQCEAIDGFNLSSFNNYEYFLALHDNNRAEIITSVLYPGDHTYDGKRLRLQQQYLLCSAGMQDILRRYKKKGRNILDFSAHCAVQLNDTHPTMAIPELIRLLMQEGLSFDDAFHLAEQTFSYTNHTVMIEALEKWDVNLMGSVVPQIYEIICRINNKLNTTLHTVNFPAQHINSMQIVQNSQIHMANLASYVCGHINGVAEIHTNILKQDVLKPWYDFTPEKFSNKTNGITQRRFLGLCNPRLTEFITRKLGTDAFLKNAEILTELRGHTDTASVEEFAKIKHENKKRLSDLILKETGLFMPPEFIFDVQIKRLHEYKRQLLNAFSIYTLYCDIKDGKIRDFTPTCFIFGAKAASSYPRAKGIIKYINELAKLINSDPHMQDVLRIVFVADYNCSYAEMIIPAADVSEQISPVGTEASGTGNMKLMLNGAVTLGTNDGANIEIARYAGYENNYIFSLNTPWGRDSGYNPRGIYDSNPSVRRALDTLINGTFSDEGSNIFRELYDATLYGASWHPADPYFILRDFDEYMEMKLKVNADYKDNISFYRKCLLNTAGAGYFSADRTVRDYAREIWHLDIKD
ncbi:MAG: glycogen/starch/alpha-glucan family phosphorylase [Clostridia bacterium]|nr:glycogen/starch/alpha-glucan family phosphorylase [Clostridia bacterium]